MLLIVLILNKCCYELLNISKSAIERDYLKCQNYQKKKKKKNTRKFIANYTYTNHQTNITHQPLYIAIVSVLLSLEEGLFIKQERIQH